MLFSAQSYLNYSCIFSNIKDIALIFAYKMGKACMSVFYITDPIFTL